MMVSEKFMLKSDQYALLCTIDQGYIDAFRVENEFN